MRKVTLLVILLAILSAITISVLVTQNLLETENKELTLKELRQESLANGKIFDRYLIPYEISPVYVEYFGGIEQANWYYNHLNNLIDLDDDREFINSVNGRALLLINFSILTDTQGASGKVAALVIQDRMEKGTYQPPNIEPLQILHEYLITEYPAKNADKVLTELLGDMKVLAPEMFDIVERKTLFGYAPTELVLEDMEYWGLLRGYGKCMFIEENNDCGKHLESARTIKENNDTL